MTVAPPEARPPRDPCLLVTVSRRCGPSRRPARHGPPTRHRHPRSQLRSRSATCSGSSLRRARGTGTRSTSTSSKREASQPATRSAVRAVRMAVTVSGGISPGAPGYHVAVSRTRPHEGPPCRLIRPAVCDLPDLVSSHFVKHRRHPDHRARPRSTATSPTVAPRRWPRNFLLTAIRLCYSI